MYRLCEMSQILAQQLPYVIIYHKHSKYSRFNFFYIFVHFGDVSVNIFNWKCINFNKLRSCLVFAFLCGVNRIDCITPLSWITRIVIVKIRLSSSVYFLLSWLEKIIWVTRKDCFLWLTFLQPPITQVIFFSQWILLLGSNHFPVFIICWQNEYYWSFLIY